MTFRRILVGWDGSDPADRALRVALGYAHTVGGEVEVLAVFDKPGTGTANDGVTDAERQNVREKFAAVFGNGPARFRAIVGSKNPAETLASFASDHDFDLIAIGRNSSGVGGDGDRTVHELAQLATTPLLVVGADWVGEPE